MANWFPMALKDEARTWLLNLAPGTISSWDKMRTPSSPTSKVLATGHLP